MFSLLLFGFLLGMRHTLEADHLAAVATLTCNARGKRQALNLGALWGLGHSLALLLCGCLALWFDQTMSTRLATTLELLVGVLLCGLGVDVLLRVKKYRVHFHTHQHPGQPAHFHAHSHPHGIVHDQHRHQHGHVTGFARRALLVGIMHGLAGSAALILLALQAVESVLTGLLYIGLFGVGSIIGMATLSLILVLPLQWQASASGLNRLHQGLQLAIGSISIVVGVRLAMANLPI